MGEPVNGVASEPLALEENTGLVSASPTHYDSSGQTIFFCLKPKMGLKSFNSLIGVLMGGLSENHLF